jgi:hypothetical protein
LLHKKIFLHHGVCGWRVKRGGVQRREEREGGAIYFVLSEQILISHSGIEIFDPLLQYHYHHRQGAVWGSP